MGVFTLAGLIFALGIAQDLPEPEDRWIAGASPLTIIVDPCDAAQEGEAGMSDSWLRAAMLERGHPRDLVCGGRTDFDPEAITSARADLLDLSAQAMARSLIMIGAISRPLDDEGSWGEKSEAGARTLYLHLKSNDYLALRELESEGPLSAPPPQ